MVQVLVFGPGVRHTISSTATHSPLESGCDNVWMYCFIRGWDSPESPWYVVLKHLF